MFAGDFVAVGGLRIFPRRRLFIALPLARRDADDDEPHQPGEGAWPGVANREGWSVDLPAKRSQDAPRTHGSNVADDVVLAERNGNRVPFAMSIR